MVDRLFDDLVNKSIEFNLGFVNRVFIRNFDKLNQDEEQNSSQLFEMSFVLHLDLIYQNY